LERVEQPALLGCRLKVGGLEGKAVRTARVTPWARVGRHDANWRLCREDTGRVCIRIVTRYTRRKARRRCDEVGGARRRTRSGLAG
jgi:hypothetical protein